MSRRIKCLQAGRLAAEDGSSAAEFALVIPVAMLLVFAIFHLCFLIYAMGALHWTVEQSARCASVGQQNTGLSCGSTISSVQTYAATIYKGPRITPTFVASEITGSNGPCRKVYGSGTYRISTGLVNIPVSISASACFPEVGSVTAWS